MTTASVLIVEDDAIQVARLKQILIQTGYRVSGLAATGEEALEAVLAQKPDAILMDIRLRGAMTGIQAAAEIHRLADIPVIYLTAYTDEDLLQQAKLTDAYAYLAKPVRDRELRASLEMALYKHATEKHLQHLNQILRAVRDVNQLITHEHDAQRLMDKACQILLGVPGHRFVWIGQAAGDRLKPIAHAGDGRELIMHKVTSATPEQGLKLPGTEAAHTRRVVVCHDMLHDERYAPWWEEIERFHFSSTVAIPILHEESLFGVLSVYSDQTNIFGAEELDLLLELTGDIAFGLKAIDRDAERQQAEQTIRESEERFSTIFHASPIPILIIRLTDGKFVDVNDAYQNLSGFRREEVIGRAAPDLNQWVNLESLHQLEMMVREQGAVSDFEAKLRAKSGLIHDTLISVVPIEVNGVPYVINLTYDITARKQHENELKAIGSLSSALRSAPERAEMLAVIVEELAALLNWDTVSVEIIDPLTGDAVTEAAHGSWEALIGTRQKSGTGINSIISQTRQPYVTNDLKNDPNLAYPEWTHKDIHGGIGAPLIAKDHLIGFLWVGRKTEMSESDVRLLVSVADMAANAVYRVTLYEQSQKDAADLSMAYDSTLEGWSHALELRDQETEGHTRRVVQMTVNLAQAMGVDPSELENTRRGALLHDIGKMAIPDSILLKPGTLNDREWEIMRRHPEYAYEFLEPIAYLRPIIAIPYCHHEKWDGSGYPRGLAGEEIPFTARIFAVVDVWDALRSDRPYRTAWSYEKTLKYIVDLSGKHFDPQVVQAFLKLLAGEK